MGSRGGGGNRGVVGGRVTVQVRKGASNLGFSAMLTQKRAGRIRLGHLCHLPWGHSTRGG